MNSAGAPPSPSPGGFPNRTMLNFLHFSSSNGGCQVPSSRHFGKGCINPTRRFAWLSHFPSNQQPLPPPPFHPRDQRQSNLPSKLPPYLRGPLASPPQPPIPGGRSPSLSKEAPCWEVHFLYQFWASPLTLAFLGVIICPSSLPLWGQFHRFSLLPKAASRELRRLGWGLEKLPVSALSETLRRNGTFNNCSSVMRKWWGPTAITQTLFWALCTYQVKWKTFWLGLTGW